MTTYADQEFFNDPDAGIDGDCWRVCVANLLAVPRETVPHFVQDHGDEWLEATQEWLAEHHGVRLKVTALPAEGALFGRVILIGRSPRDLGHSVLGDVDGNVLHDPHPSRDGLASQSLVLKAVISLQTRIAAMRDELTHHRDGGQATTTDVLRLLELIEEVRGVDRKAVRQRVAGLLAAGDRDTAVCDVAENGWSL